MVKAIPAERDETRIEEYKLPYTPNQALVEAERCLFCFAAPCINACPTAIDIPQFIRKITTGNLWGAARTILAANILGQSCARVCPVEVLCVGDCVFHEKGEAPIEIGKLQRFATDHAYEKGWRFAEAGADSGKRVALVGAGPASLAAAHELRRLGHACAIIEKGQYIGGLNTIGIAPYKLLADEALSEAEWVLEIGGIEVKQGVELGKDVTLSDLEQEYDAVFLGFGLGSDTLLSLPGAELPGVEGALAFIERFKLGHVDLEGVNIALVVGGGNTAIDAVRELVKLGVPDVRLVYRGNRGAMPGYAHEMTAARLEGVRAHWHTQPVRYEGEDRVVALHCVKTDAQKQAQAGTEHRLPADLVLLAVGQATMGGLLEGAEGIRLEKGVVQINESGATGRPGVYAGGDCTNGGTEVVQAVAEGKRAAEAIDQYLREQA